MWIKQRTFNILYYGNTIKVKAKLNNNGNLKYLIDLPEGILTLRMEFDDNEISYWIEEPGGRTKLSEQLGQIIEDTDNIPT